ncbi:T9SS type B sorting domain-containing protein [Flavobacterium sp. 7A]|uniref:T9SS type B sorting domain-containing protein n=1 Tax=Flavobacterium sp. 7A TaxID=2940571 RepID=UPI002226E372|nr:T9SS type B sorting domain-containing protein [Flavobacterium sp. 7A]MCW2118335.1 gliding motility-associated-like protein [Flavobacterium sp. 7A]
MKKLYLLFCLVFYTGILAQSITVDDSSRDANQLIQLLLGNSCTTVSNISISSNQSTAYFNNNSSSFPINEGVIIRNGIAKHTEGPYTGLNLSSELNTNTDPDLQKISNSTGQNIPITDVAYLQFDFVPLSNEFSFDFLFASNEYGEYQCGFSDVFAFLLTDLDENTTQNLAIVPGSSDPISVKNIRDNKYNSSCASVNSNLFSTYTVSDPLSSTLNMRGYTQVLTASATITPNHLYRIRLMIGDANDSNYDSAVFLRSGSFTTNADLGPNQTICEGNTVEIKTGLTDPKYHHVWKKDDQIIIGENKESLMVTQAGTYEVVIEQVGTSCVITDKIIFSNLKTNNSIDLRNCNSGAATYIYDLTTNNAKKLAIDETKYELFYYETSANAQTNTKAIENPQTYENIGEQTIYIKIKNKTTNTFCNWIQSFQLLLDTPALPKKPNNIEICDNTTGNKINLLINNSIILNGQDPDTYTISYHSSPEDAATDSNALPSNYTVTSFPKVNTVWVRMTNILSKNCFNITSFDIIVNPKPLVDRLEKVIECVSYTLPPLTNGNYYTESDGKGTMLHAGDLIETSGTFYIYSISGDSACTNQSTFNVIISNEYSIPLDYCGVFIVPDPSIGNFYTNSGGPDGTGTLLPTGTKITTNQTVYYYAVVNGSICTDDSYAINILPLPILDPTPNVVTCNSYKLPILSHGEYYTASDGLGEKLSAGTVITKSQSIYVYSKQANCANQNIFNVTIIPSVIDQPSCGSYKLPDLPTGKYYTEPEGAGSSIPFGTTITESTTIYIYANTTIIPNCTNNMFFKVNIKPIPIVDQIKNVLRCKEDPYVLSTLIHGDYFTGPNRTGIHLKEGDQITNSKTIYINNIVDGCTNESSFKVEIRELPKLTIITDVTTCKSYKIPTVSDGLFYSESKGKGKLIAPGTIITQTQVIYLYNKWPDLSSCDNENAININIIGIKVDNPVNVKTCNSYTLPALTSGNYYTQPGGKGTLLNAGSIIPSTQKLYIYGKNGTRFICEDENEFIITISKTPNLLQPSDIAICNSYTLPELTEGNYYEKSNGSGTKYFAGDEIKKDQTLYVYATATDNINCFDEKKFNITIYPLNNLELKNGVICVDYKTGELLNPAYIDSGLDPIKYTVDWLLNGELVGTGSDFIATQEGTYDVDITKNVPDIGNDCGYNPTSFNIIKSSPAIANINVSDSFTDKIDVTAIAILGYGSYEFKLDDGSYQESPIFKNINSGEHSISIIDKKGNCNPTIITAIVLNHPKFFTPNNDGYNDFWNIPELASQPNAVISIFDRYGKLITQLNPSSNGWDGRYHNTELPSDDYWFVVNYNFEKTSKIYKSHFSLKR